MLFGLAAGLFLASLLEALRWTDFLARAAYPLARLAHFGPTAASAFALAFVSPAAANSLLAEKYETRDLNSKELMLANLFNGLPAWLGHFPTLILLTWAALGSAAIIYAGLTFAAALGRTIFTMCVGRIVLATPGAQPAKPLAPNKARFAGRLLKAWQRFKKRLPKLLLFTAPVYLLMWIGQQTGFFLTFEAWLARHLDWLTFLKPQAMGIIALQLLAEMGATLGAASAALQDGSLNAKDVILAMLTGNILATPLRAIHHQFPAYAGFFKPALAFRLVLANQALRALSIVVITASYWLWF